MAEVTSDWQVQDGTIEITVTQFGNSVTGSFSDWTAQITFDETTTDRKKGDVVATISIPSLTLGSVTQQALGADFFDATNHPTATFAADLMAASDGYEATGTLTIKGTAVPVSMPFALAITDDSAEMRGALTLDRRSFQIGANMADEQNLGFAVDVLITLTANRAP
ncbi:YceI family protein [Sulfitobacter aestuariivivens]|uniref:YceI family protein n=1 Tax=Sulfitobacter aestuariivivens TaxID=2766981 RepID=UPI003613F0E6